jgi:cellulose biosynthesis protein BcsQ
MQLLILDINTELQANYAFRVQKFPASELETMDISLTLANDNDYVDHLEHSDVVILGSGLKERAFTLARDIVKAKPGIIMILFISDASYSQRAIRNAHYVGARKVLPEAVSDLDFLQELVAIDAEFRRDGRAPLGKVISVISAKGGVGCTSVVAALAEVANNNDGKSVIWDLDLETRDLSRGLSIFSNKGGHFSAWLQNTTVLNKKSFSDALISVSRNVNLLMPPDDFTLSPELFSTENGTTLLERLLDLSRYSHQYVIVDVAGNRGYAVDTILTLSDEIVLLVSDCLLDASGLDIFLNNLKRSLGSLEKVRIVASGQSAEFMLALKSSITAELPERAWEMPSLPTDSKAGEWPASGNTLFSMASRDLRFGLHQLAYMLEMVPAPDAAVYGKPSWLKVLSGGGLKNLNLAQAAANLKPALKDVEKQKALPAPEPKLGAG